jgi:hypothetical protein
MAHWFEPGDARWLVAMTFSAPPRPAPRLGRLVGGTLVGSILVTTGLSVAYLVLTTPLVETLVPSSPGGRQVAIGFGIWSFSLVAGGALLVSGTSRLAAILAMLRGRVDLRYPARRAIGSGSDEMIVVADVVPGEGRPIPELVIGAFGVAVIHFLAPSRPGHLGRAAQQPDTGASQRSSGDPLAAVVRDSDRVRRWLSEADLDFVVRVYAALVVSDRTLERSPNCAVISPEQIPAWIASLPRQRTLTAGRRGKLLAMARPSAGPVRGPRERGW